MNFLPSFNKKLLVWIPHTSLLQPRLPMDEFVLYEQGCRDLPEHASLHFGANLDLHRCGNKSVHFHLNPVRLFVRAFSFLSPILQLQWLRVRVRKFIDDLRRNQSNSRLELLRRWHFHEHTQHLCLQQWCGYSQLYLPHCRRSYLSRSHQRQCN